MAVSWHNGDRPFTCNWIYCGKKFTRSDELQRHKRTHTGQQLIQCIMSDYHLCRIVVGRDVMVMIVMYGWWSAGYVNMSQNKIQCIVHYMHVPPRISCLLICPTIFTVRRYALHGLCDRNSVCLSVRLSHSCTVSTWFDLRSWFLHHIVAPSF